MLSTRLDIKPWLAVDPQLEFKLDPTPEWDERLMREIAATGRVRALDFKSFYEGSPVDNPPDPVQYRLVSETFPGAVLEDPALEGPAREALRGQEGRFSFDAPIHSWEDVEAMTARVAAVCGPECDGFALRQLNIKPSRFGSLSALLDCVGRAQAAGMVLYGGGQFELGIGRDQIQALASLLYADGPNDVAPREYHGDAHAGRAGQPARAAGVPGRRLRVRVRGLRLAARAGAAPRSRFVQQPLAIEVRDALADRGLVQQFQDDGGAAGARRAEHRARVDHAPAQRQVRVAGVRRAAVVVQVDVRELRVRLAQEVVQRPADRRVPGVEDEPEPAEVQVAGRAEVRVPEPGHVLDDDAHAELALVLLELGERPLQRVQHAGIRGTAQPW